MKKLILFIAMLIFIPKVNAEVISLNSDNAAFGVHWNNYYNYPDYFTINPQSSRSFNLSLYNYEGVTRPYTYLVMSMCSNYSPDNWEVINSSYTESYFVDGPINWYLVSDEPCNIALTNPTKTGYKYYLQFEVGKYFDYDGTGEELEVFSTVKGRNSDIYGGWYGINTWYLSSEDLVTQFAKDREMLNKFNQLDNSIIDLQSNVESGFGSVNNKIQAQIDAFNQGFGNLSGKQEQTNENLDKIDGSINDLNDSINNSNTDNPSSKIEEFESMLPENGVITRLITLPISLFQNVLTSINGTCQQYSLGSLFGTNLTLPCINISNYLGTTLWNVIDVLFSGLFVFVIAKKMIKVFNNFTSMEEGDVLD